MCLYRFILNYYNRFDYISYDVEFCLFFFLLLVGESYDYVVIDDKVNICIEEYLIFYINFLLYMYI